MAKTSPNKKQSASIETSTHMDAVIREYFLHTIISRDISAKLNDKTVHVSQEPITRRQIHHWTESGLLPERDGTGWNRFSIMESLWLQIVFQLRTNFEVRHDGIKRIYDCLTEGANKYNAFMPVFEIYISEALTRKRKIYLIVFSDKSAAVADENTITAILKSDTQGHVLILDMNALLKNILPKYEWALQSKKE
ncbi:hypothetical protein BH09BAC5_BH09BAC5_09980 [soil metagenome]